MKGSDNVLDMRLLGGNLGDPSGTTSVLERMMKKLKDSYDQSYVNATILLAGSGFGKSKSILDLGCHYYVTMLEPPTIGSTFEDMRKLATYFKELEIQCSAGVM